MEEQPINPMSIPHVIETLCKHKSFTDKDLLNLRCVSRDWNYEATKAYEERSTLTLDRDSGSSSKMYGAIVLIQAPSGNFPFPTTVKLDSAMFLEHRKVLHPFQCLFVAFLNLISPKLENLELLIKSDNLHDLDLAEFNSSAQFMNLKTFFFNVEQEHWGSGRNYFLQLGMRVLAHSPMLEEVKVYERGTNMSQASPESFVETKIIRNIPPSVTRVSIAKIFTVSTTYEIKNLALPELTSLHLRMMNGTLGRYTFCQMFENCHRTLTDLKIEDYAGGMQFPVFPIMKTLTLELWPAIFKSGGHYTDHSLEPFARIFPQVETVNMHNVSKSVMEGLFPTGFFAPGVKSCQFPDVVEDAETVLNFAHGFPELKQLEIRPPCNPKTLETVFESMGNLEELTIGFRTMQRQVSVDSILTGISKEVCIYLRSTNGWKEVKLEKVKSRPGISDLKQLRKLHMTGVPGRQSFLTDLTGYLGLLQMPELTCLRTDKFDLSAECMQQLKSRFGDSVILPNADPKTRARNLSIMDSYWMEVEQDSDSEFYQSDDSSEDEGPPYPRIYPYPNHKNFK